MRGSISTAGGNGTAPPGTEAPQTPQQQRITQNKTMKLNCLIDVYLYP